MEFYDFVAWSLYTGPSEFNKILDNSDCSWYTGVWNGLNQDTSPAEIKKDIDVRIDLVISGFMNVLPRFNTKDRHFVLPEFFFHCAQGPYPNIKVDGILSPFEYILAQFEKRLNDCIPTDGNCYGIIIGSVLTSNIDDYDVFLKSPLVIERMQELNSILPPTLQSSIPSSTYTRWNRIGHSPSPSQNLMGAELSQNAIIDNNLKVFMAEAKRNPLCTVHNQGAYFYFNKSELSKPAIYRYSKQNESTIDLTMGTIKNGALTHNGMITEWMCNYPSYTLYRGDKHTAPTSHNARFTPPGVVKIDYGVEICLDHCFQRLRRTVGMKEANGALTDNYPLQKHFIPSGSCQILDYSVAANNNSVVFNADGCGEICLDWVNFQPILDGKSGLWKGITCGVYTQSVQSKWNGSKDGKIYYSHSQLAFTTDAYTLDGFDNTLGTNNIKARTYKTIDGTPFNPSTDNYQAQIIPFRTDTPLFAATTGELHHYTPQ